MFNPTCHNFRMKEIPQRVTTDLARTVISSLANSNCRILDDVTIFLCDLTRQRVAIDVTWFWVALTRRLRVTDYGALSATAKVWHIGSESGPDDVTSFMTSVWRWLSASRHSHTANCRRYRQGRHIGQHAVTGYRKRHWVYSWRSYPSAYTPNPM